MLLVGSRAARLQLRAQLDLVIAVEGEFDTEDEARASGIAHDALVVAAEGQRPERRRRPGSDPADELLDDPLDDPLTPRELQVLGLLASGLSNKAIAVRLGISDQTVKFHVAAISGKLGASNRTDAVRRALRKGLIAL